VFADVVQLSLQCQTIERGAYLRRAGLVQTRREGLWVYYRIADLPDPVLRTISEAVQLGLARTEAVQRDAQRLSRRTGCCLPVPSLQPPTSA